MAAVTGTGPSPKGYDSLDSDFFRTPSGTSPTPSGTNPKPAGSIDANGGERRYENPSATNERMRPPPRIQVSPRSFERLRQCQRRLSATVRLWIYAREQQDQAVLARRFLNPDDLDALWDVVGKITKPDDRASAAAETADALTAIDDLHSVMSAESDAEALRNAVRRLVRAFQQLAEKCAEPAKSHLTELESSVRAIADESAELERAREESARVYTHRTEKEGIDVTVPADVAATSGTNVQGDGR